jgi:hypothetical protein
MGHPNIPCSCGQTAHPQELSPLSISPYSAWPFPLPPTTVVSPSPKCPATHRHTRRFGTEVTGVQCKYEPGHDGDHCAFVFGDGDIFWPQETLSGLQMTDEIDADPDEAARLRSSRQQAREGNVRWDPEEGDPYDGGGGGGASWSPPPGTIVRVT